MPRTSLPLFIGLDELSVRNEFRPRDFCCKLKPRSVTCKNLKKRTEFHVCSIPCSGSHVFHYNWKTQCKM